MSQDGSSEFKVFDVETIEKFVELMNEHGLSEIDLQQDEQKIRLSKQISGTQVAPVAAAPAPIPQAAPSSADSGTNPNLEAITSPMVGTYYSAPKPGEPDYVKVGDHVNNDTVVCLLEAMKTFNELNAGVSGKIVEILVNNEDAVDVNKPLFRVDTSQ